LRGLERALDVLGWSFTSRPFKERDWGALWRRRLKPIRVSAAGSSVVIKPTWSGVRKRPGDVLIEMDPGMAFGTGAHATTRTCLKAMLSLIKNGAPGPSSFTFLDIGTGTGILAIAARLLGAEKALGIDVDSVAVNVARKNSRLNRVDVRISGTPLERVKGRFDVVAANILAGDLIRLSPAISARVRPGGHLILSGILAKEAALVNAAYADEPPSRGQPGIGRKHGKPPGIKPLSGLEPRKGLEAVKTYRSGEWATLLYVKDAPARAGRP
jgi:ribosomal protein L11 methyltransferase